ncbi:MAG: hypothetical protein M3Q65_13045 [Chloroflexota bacterium]|nr:hypothetical protein [Chloroflexota bacterium]
MHAFSGSDGAQPQKALIQAGDGSLYGTTPNGGAHDQGTVFRLDAAGNHTVLHSFDRCDPAGYRPLGSLIQARDGSFYGTTSTGGEGNDCTGFVDNRHGAIFRIDAAGVVSVLHTFYFLADGQQPYARLVEGSDGSLYGTTRIGGIGDPVKPSGRGTIYKVDKAGNFTLLHRLSNFDGQHPLTGLVQGTDGFFYGTTNEYQTPERSAGGTVFRIDAEGNFTLLHVFGTGRAPRGDLIQARDGLFYGTTESGGAYNSGTIYRIDAAGNYTLLHDFGFDGGYGTTGGSPVAGLIQASDGSFYGTAQYGGIPIDADRRGVIYKMDAAGKVGVLHTFYGGADYSTPGGTTPMAALVETRDGMLYGVALGGPSGSGVVFRYDLHAPAALSRLGVYPTRVIGGDALDGAPTANVILDAPAPPGGAVVKLTSSKPRVAGVPASVTVAEGWATANFTVATSDINRDTAVTISATYNGVTKQVTLTVLR